MKNAIFSLILLTLTSTATFAQKSKARRVTMTISWGKAIKTVPVINASYSFSNSDNDSSDKTPTAYLSVSAGHNDVTILKAASRQQTEGLMVAVKSYDSTGALTHTIILKDAKIAFVSDIVYSETDAVDDDGATSNIGIQSDDISVDGVAL